MQEKQKNFTHKFGLIISIGLIFALLSGSTLYLQNEKAHNILWILAASTLSFILITSVIVLHMFKRMQKLIQQSNARYQQMIETNQDLLWETDISGLFTYVSPTATNLLGYAPEEFLGKSSKHFMSTLEAEHFEQASKEYFKKQKPYQLLQKILLHKDGSQVVLQSSGTPIFDHQGSFKGYHGIDRDITIQHRDKEFIEHLAYHDQLTGLPNRKMLEQLLTQELSRAQRHKRFGALFFIDLDNFKRINDSLGHHVGDQLLQSISERITKYIREEDTIARLGGDEFILLLPELSNNEDKARQHASDTAYKMLSLLTIPINVGQHILNIGGSIGISIFPSDGQQQDMLMRHADTAMYLAKSSGKNTFKFYQPYLQEQMEQRVSLEQKLRHALSVDQLELYYQPQYDFNNHQFTAIEALLRWPHPEDGMIFPEQFISVAEESGLILKMGEWVLEQAMFQNASWSRQGLCHLPIAINLSAIQFRQSNLKQNIVNALNKTGMPAELLEIELTESALMQDYNLTVDILMLIKSSGGSVAIDDFGTGYSNLSVLKNLPINKLKIDRSFVDDLENNEHIRIICQTIIRMAQSMNLKTIAEGVETQGQKAFLKENACDGMQGYLLAKPMPAKEFEVFMNNFTRSFIKDI